MKDQDKSPEKELTEGKISYMFNKDFKCNDCNDASRTWEKIS